MGQRASSGNIDAQQAWKTALDHVSAPCIEAEALVQIAALLSLSRWHLENKEQAAADKMASEAVTVAEKAMVHDALNEALYQLAVVRKAGGDFIVAEGLFRTCAARVGSSSARSPTTWQLLLLDKVTRQHSEMLEAMSFNNNSRKPEAQLVRDQYVKLQKTYPVTASAAARLLQSALEHWYYSSLLLVFTTSIYYSSLLLVFTISLLLLVFTTIVFACSSEAVSFSI